MAYCILTKPTEPLKPLEHFSIKIAIGVNLAWVFFATILAIAICFKTFDVRFSNESIWAIVGLVIAFCVYAFEAYRSGYLAFGVVFPYTCFALFDKYEQIIRHESKINLLTH